MILHLGLGRFHRGHQGVYYQRLKDLGDARWGVVALSLRSPEARDQVNRVHHRYPVLELSATEDKLIWVEAIREALFLGEDFSRILKVFQDRSLQIISLTITEKGYDLDGSGQLDFSKDQIKQDLRNSDHPKSAIGLLAIGLRRRRIASAGPVTVLSCDNLRENGKKLKGALLAYVEELGWQDDLVWIRDEIKFPNTMVDRIVPSLLPQKVEALEKEFGIPAHSELIATEKFSQWVIEDTFANERPDWEKVGVQFVDDVRPFEELKLKLLNASHSYLAYAGLNRGYSYVHEAVADPELQSNVLALYEEVSPVLEIPTGFDLSAYKRDLLERFRNNKLPHQLKQIAMDGSQKLPQRIFPSLLMTSEKKLRNDVLALTIKEWMDNCFSLFENNSSPDDPEKELLKEIYSSRSWEANLWASKLLAPIRSCSPTRLE